MSVQEFASREGLIDYLADSMADDLRAAITLDGAATLAVPGGSTPGPVFDRLSGAGLDWSKVTILPGDERWVPETSEHSNAAQIRARLLRGKAMTAQFLPLYDGGDGSVGALSARLEPLLPLTVVFLGMGGDMHTASLFPGDKVLGTPTGAILHYVPVPGLDPRVPRMTLTPAAINGAKRKYLVLFGDDKLAAYKRALSAEDPVQAPILAVSRNLNVLWAE